MAVTRLSTGSDATWNRAWVIDTTAEVTAFMATYGTPLGPRRGDMILDNEAAELFMVTNGSAIEQLTGKATLPIDLVNDVSNVLPTANGGTNVDIASAALLLGSGQLQFPAVQNPSANANTLDDFERGSWTPAFGGNGGESGQVYSSQNGAYVKIGRLIVAWFEMTLSTLGTITGGLVVRGFPFAASNLAPGIFGNAPAFWLSWAIAQITVQLSIASNDTFAYVITITAPDTGIGNQPTSAALTNTSILRGAVIYFGAA